MLPREDLRLPEERVVVTGDSSANDIAVDPITLYFCQSENNYALTIAVLIMHTILGSRLAMPLSLLLLLEMTSLGCLQPNGGLGIHLIQKLINGSARARHRHCTSCTGQSDSRTSRRSTPVLGP